MNELVSCCEECLGAPNSDRVCPHHPYARLILVDADEALAERHLLRELHNNRLRALLKAVAMVLFVILWFKGIQTMAMGRMPLRTVLFASPALLFFPAIWLLRSARPRRSNRLPLWLSGLLAAEGWLLVMSGLRAWHWTSADVLVGPLFVPFAVVVVGMLSALAAQLQKEPALQPTDATARRTARKPVYSTASR